jgi:hypothetical protein
MLFLACLNHPRRDSLTAQLSPQRGRGVLSKTAGTKEGLRLVRAAGDMIGCAAASS